MTALALRDDQDYWDDKQLAVLYQTGIGEDVSKAELAAYLHECQRRKLDPFVKQIYLIGRYDRRAGRKVYRTQTSIDGFRLIARRAADKAGIDYAYEDTIWFDSKGGRHEVWLVAEPPAAVKVVVVRNGSRYDAVANFSEYVQTDEQGQPVKMWKSMPANQLAKCCEALALRKAFPEDLGGLYTEEEMAQADNPQVVQATATVIREEPLRPVEHLNTAPAGDAPPSAEDVAAWLEKALVRAPAPDLTEDEAATLWREATAHRQAGVLSADDSKQIKGVLTERFAEFKAAADASDADVVEGIVVDPAAVTGLDPEDPWSAKIETITDEADGNAAKADVAQGVKAGHITAERAEVITNAINLRVMMVLGGKAA